MRLTWLLIALFVLGCKDDPAKKEEKPPASAKEIAVAKLANRFLQRIDSLLPSIKSYAQANRLDLSVAFVADLSLHSGVPRFAVVDLKSDTITRSSLVAHGRGEYLMTSIASFSNVPNSRLSSVGRYKIGRKYNGQFGKAYKLHGLDSTNNKAFQRFIVLHAYECVPDKIIYPRFLCCSDGCPMVSHQFLEELSEYIDKTEKPVLLWILG